MVESEPKFNEFYTLPIEALGLAASSKNCLKKDGINTVAQLLTRDRLDLLKLSGFGKKSFKFVEDAVDRLGAALGILSDYRDIIEEDDEKLTSLRRVLSPETNPWAKEPKSMVLDVGDFWERYRGKLTTEFMQGVLSDTEVSEKVREVLEEGVKKHLELAGRELN